MELFELKYFLGVAENENIHRASEKLNVSPASLSKAISRLEEDLSVRLFSREGRNIRLTDHGRLFQRRAAEIVQLEEAARLEISGHKGQVQVVLAGPEILLLKSGLDASAELKKKYEKMSFEFRAVDDREALGQVLRGEAHLALITSEPPEKQGLVSKVVSEAHFLTVVAHGHPLFAAASKGQTIPVEKVLEHGFVSPNLPFLGEVGARQSLDGWRDDQFPRKIEFLTSSLKTLETLVMSGRAVAYLPDYFTEKIGATTLKISGCPYSCTQKIKLICKNPKDRSWLRDWF